VQIAFASDMHGNLLAFEAVLAEMERRGPLDAVLGGGDFAANGLYPAECVQRLMDLGWECVRGNTEEWLVATATNGEIPVHDCPPEMMHDNPELQALDRWGVARLSQAHIDFLAGLPLSYTFEGPSGQTLMLAHATPWSAHPPVTADAPDDAKRELLERAGTDALVYGHIHHAYLQQVDGKTIACIGAVGLPFDGDRRASFAIATDDGDGWRIEHVRVEYDNETYARELEASDMPGATGVANVVRTGGR
jgi:predicted phosphodiesterase